MEQAVKLRRFPAAKATSAALCRLADRRACIFAEIAKILMRWAPNMQQFILHENIDRFEKLLAVATEPEKRRLLKSLLEAERAKLALLELGGAHSVHSSTVARPAEGLPREGAPGAATSAKSDRPSSATGG